MDDEGFPLDWNQWRVNWSAWIAKHERTSSNPNGKLVLRHQLPEVFHAKNMLADEVLGVYELPDGRCVELSELVMPDFSAPATSSAQVRRIGVAFAVNHGPLVGWLILGTDVMATFVQLEQALEIG